MVSFAFSSIDIAAISKGRTGSVCWEQGGRTGARALREVSRIDGHFG